MNIRVINPQKLVAKLNQQPPIEYINKKNEIEEQIRLLELKCSLENREPTDKEIQQIVNLKLEKDEILANWIDPL